MYCEEQKKVHVNNDRAKTAERGYGGRWQRESKRFLREHPMCNICFQNGVITEATVVDHINHTVEIRNSSGIVGTGRHYVSRAMTTKHCRKILILCIRSDE
jgi:hypothetical protein